MLLQMDKDSVTIRNHEKQNECSLRQEKCNSKVYSLSHITSKCVVVWTRLSFNDEKWS